MNHPQPWKWTVNPQAQETCSRGDLRITPRTCCFALPATGSAFFLQNIRNIYCSLGFLCFFFFLRKKKQYNFLSCSKLFQCQSRTEMIGSLRQFHEKCFVAEQHRMWIECVICDVLEALNLPPRRDNWRQCLNFSALFTTGSSLHHKQQVWKQKTNPHVWYTSPLRTTHNRVRLQVHYMLNCGG